MSPTKTDSAWATHQALLTEREQCQAEVRRLGEGRNALRAPFKAAKRKLGPAPVRLPDGRNADEVDGYRRRYEELESPFLTRRAELDERIGALNRRVSELNAEIPDAARKVRAERQAEADAACAGDVVALAATVAQAETVHAALVAALADVPHRLRAALQDCDPAAARQARDDGIDLPVRVQLASIDLARARVDLARAELAEAARSDDDTRQAFEDADARMVAAEAERRQAHTALQQSTMSVRRLRDRVRRLEQDLHRAAAR